MAKYEVLQKTFIKGVMYQPGEIIDIDDSKLVIGDNLKKIVDPVEEAAKAEAKAEADKLDAEKAEAEKAAKKAAADVKASEKAAKKDAGGDLV